MAVAAEIEIELPVSESRALTELVVRTCTKTLELHGEGDPDIACVIADSDRLHNLNKRFRNVDKPTDVLAFPAGEGAGGDIAIALDIATKHAEEAGWSREREVAYLIAHATLHLLGHDHDDDDAYCLMRLAEEEVLEALGYRRTEEY
jgi:probable rRNA maturation factor